MKTTVIGNWEGLGDNVSMTPAIRKYKKEHPDEKIIMYGQERFGQSLTGLWEGLVDEVYPSLPDAWGYGNYEHGRREVTKHIRSLASAERADKIYILCASGVGEENRNNYKFNKIFRYAECLGVTLDSIDECKTELSYCKETEEYIRKYYDRYVIVHANANVASKKIRENDIITIQGLIDEKKELGYKFYEIDGKSFDFIDVEFGTNNMEFSKTIIKNANLVIAADSVVMHIAGAFNVPLIAVFNYTVAHQAFPMWNKNAKAIGIENKNTHLANLKNHIKDFSENYDV